MPSNSEHTWRDLGRTRCGWRSPRAVVDMIVAMLAVLKAEGLRSPSSHFLDATSFFFSRDSGPSVVLRRGARRALLQLSSRLPGSDAAPAIARQSEQLARPWFGSPGWPCTLYGGAPEAQGGRFRPIGFRPLVRTPPCPLRSPKVFLQAAPGRFDASTSSLWPLFNGGRSSCSPLKHPPGRPREAIAARRHDSRITACLFHLAVAEGAAGPETPAGSSGGRRRSLRASSPERAPGLPGRIQRVGRRSNDLCAMHPIPNSRRGLGHRPRSSSPSPTPTSSPGFGGRGVPRGAGQVYIGPTPRAA